MLVPKAAVNEYGSTMSGEYNVRRTVKVPAVQPESIPQLVQDLPHNDLGFGVFRPDA
jgi:hypothetical protein